MVHPAPSPTHIIAALPVFVHLLKQPQMAPAPALRVTHTKPKVFARACSDITYVSSPDHAVRSLDLRPYLNLPSKPWVSAAPNPGASTAAKRQDPVACATAVPSTPKKAQLAAAGSPGLRHAAAHAARSALSPVSHSPMPAYNRSSVMLSPMMSPIKYED